MSLAEDAVAWTAEAKQNQWADSMVRVKAAWTHVLSAIKKRAKEGNDTAMFSGRNVRHMKKWDYLDRDTLVECLRKHGFRARQDDGCVYVWWWGIDK